MLPYSLERVVIPLRGVDTLPVRLVGELAIRSNCLGPKGIAVATQLLLGEVRCVCAISNSMTLVTWAQTPTSRTYVAVLATWTKTSSVVNKSPVEPA